MTPNEKNIRTSLALYWFLAAAGALIGFYSLYRIPVDPKNQVIFGFSLARLLVMGVFLGAVMTALIGLGLVWRVPPRWRRLANRLAENQPVCARVLRIAFFLGLAAILTNLTPAYQFGRFHAYLERLRPLIWYLAQLSLMAVWLLAQFQPGPDQSAEAGRAGVRRWVYRVSFGLLFAGWGLVALTGIGLYPNESRLWYEVSVPILGQQIGLAALLSGGFYILLRYLRARLPWFGGIHWHWLDLFISIGILLTAFSLWNNATYYPNYFAPGPYLPEMMIYPYSDAATWDFHAQRAIIGQEIGVRNVDHPGYMGLLTILHLLFKQDYFKIVMAQIALYAAFPVGAYWLGKSFHSRFLGFFFAVLAICVELNAYAASSMLNLSHSRLLMTEPLTRLFLLILAWLLFLWFREPEQIGYAIPTGGVLGLLVMLRFNALVMPVAVLFGIGIIYLKNWRAGLKSAALLVVAFGITLAPWMYHNAQLGGSPVFFAEKLVGFAFDGGFRMPDAWDSPEPAAQSPDETAPAQPAANPNSAAQPAQTQSQSLLEKNRVYFILNHYAHNFITSVLILPTQPFFHNLRTTIYETAPFWKADPDLAFVNLNRVHLVGITAILIVLAVGLAQAFLHWRLAGLVPLGVFLAYNFSTAGARTSGGRYVIPVDWVVLFYFGLGLLGVFAWFGPRLGFKSIQADAKPPQASFSIWKGILTALPGFLFVFSLALIDEVIPPRYFSMTQNEVLDLLVEQNLLASTGFSRQQLEALLTDPATDAVYGFDLTPRYYKIDQGERKGPYGGRAYPRLVFTMIGPFGYRDVILPLAESPQKFSSGQDVIVIGCSEPDTATTIQAIVVVVVSEPPQVFTRQPVAPLACPLPEPVCDSQEGCR